MKLFVFVVGIDSSVTKVATIVKAARCRLTNPNIIADAVSSFGIVLGFALVVVRNMGRTLNAQRLYLQ
jgi:hypothetical protein